MFANHAAVSIANARAFSEIERLKTQLELENSYLREEVRIALSTGDDGALREALRVADGCECADPR